MFMCAFSDVMFLLLQVSKVHQGAGVRIDETNMFLTRTLSSQNIANIPKEKSHLTKD